MNEEMKEQIQFALDDDDERMQAALGAGSDLDDENKQMSRELIRRHEEILMKLDLGDPLSQEDLQLIRDANEIHVNDTEDLNGRHREAIVLEDWLDRDSRAPARVYRALHTLWEEATPDGIATEAAFSNEGRCLQCSSKVSFADVTDTVVFVGDEIVKRYDGDILNRNCVRCTYPEHYPDYEDYDKAAE